MGAAHLHLIHPDANEFAPAGPASFYLRSAVTFEPGKVLKCGGYNPDDCQNECAISARTVIFDVATEEWEEADEMFSSRRDHNLSLLPDGAILAVGGQNGCTFNPALVPTTESCYDPNPDPPVDCLVQCGCCTPVLRAERYDPSLGELAEWVPMALATRPRGYHNTAVLLADGRVINAGGENDNFPPPPEDPEEWPYHSSRSAEIYSPAYLFTSEGDAVRPEIACAPSEALYDSTFTVRVGGVSELEDPRVSLIRLPAVSHGFDENQRFMWLGAIVSDYVEDEFILTVAAPETANLAPPGHYLLFVLSDDGVPSEGHYIRIDAFCAANINREDGVDGADMADLLAAWGGEEPGCENAAFCPADLNGDGFVNGTDLAMLLAAWGTCPTGAECVPESQQSSSSSSSSSSEADEQLLLFWYWYSMSDWGAFFDWLAEQPGGQ